MNSAPPCAPSAAAIVPPCAWTIALQMARPRPTPGVADSAWPRVNLSNRACARPRIDGGSPGPWSRTATTRAASVACAAITIGGAPYFAAFSSRLTSTRSISTASNSTSGRSGARSVATTRSPSAGRATRIAAPTTSSTDCHSRRSATAAPPPASRRAMSSRLPTSACRARACATMARAVSARARSAGDPAVSVSGACSESASPTSAVSGVRTSCEIAASSVLRSDSDSISTTARCATST